MSLKTAHEGYEYQDLLTVYFILDCILQEEETTFLIDTKEFDLDKFDDVTIRNSKGIFKKQIKYSNSDIDHTIKKRDLSAGGSYNLAVDELFESWYTHPDKEFLNAKLCLAWNDGTDDLLKVLNVQDGIGTFTTHNTTSYKINIEKLWPKNKEPIASWSRFKSKSKGIKRKDFKAFCEVLIIELNFPKFSLSIYEPGSLEKIVLDQADRIGIGLFPNNKVSKEQFILSLSALVKKSRSNGDSITTKDIFKQFEIVTDFGSIEQNFPIDDRRNILTKNKVSSVTNLLKSNRRLILTGEPGSGKSWFVNNLIEELGNHSINTVKHYCYTDLQDKFQKDRIKKDVFYGNIISEIIDLYPELKNKKKQRYASSLSELNLLISHIVDPTVLIIDGLDHIQRIFDYRPYDDMSFSEIDIINEVNLINTSEHVSVLVASQPIKELAKIEDFKKISIPKWTKDDVKGLMSKFHLEDLIINEKSLSELLYVKGSTNPLYLTYIIEELKTLKSIELNTIESLPAYSHNLEDYYNYLLEKVNLNDQVPFALSAVNFSLTKQELKDITGLGIYVDESLALLKPVLKQNTASSGYVIYHESFRRFILEHLKSKEVLEQRIFQPVIEWLEGLDFYNYPKAYRFFLEVLIDGGYYSKAQKFISKNFIKNSVFSGHPWGIIENNYRLLVKAGIESRDFVNLIILNEINKTIVGIKDSYDEAFLEYIEALGCKRGFGSISELLVYEEKPTRSMEQGLGVCRLINAKGFVAPWEFYSGFFKKGEAIKLEHFSLYISLCLAQKNGERLLDIAEQLKKKGMSEFRGLFRKELKQTSTNDFVKELVSENSKIRDIVEPKKKKRTMMDLLTLAQEIFEFEHVFDSEKYKILVFLDQIEIQLNDDKQVSECLKLFTGINWFYNWLIYAIKVMKIKAAEDFDALALRNAFEVLNYDTAPFKGNPRTNDLHSINDIIYQSLSEGLSLLPNEEEWKYALKILDNVSTVTTVYFQNSPSGPIATNDFFKLLLDNINDNNAQTIIDILEKQYIQNKDGQFHAFLSEYCFQLVKAFHFTSNQKQVEYYYNKGVDYIIGYTWRRDLTIEDLTESVVAFNDLNPVLGHKYILELKSLIDSVVNHTDGKDTKHFPSEWFEKFHSINNEPASRYLLYELSSTRYDWRLESSLKYLIENENISPLTKCFLNQTFPLETDESFLIDTLNLAENLDSKVARNTLFSTIKPRLEIEKDDKYSNEFHERLAKHSKNLELNRGSSVLKSKRNIRKSSVEDAISQIKLDSMERKEFPDMTHSELLDYLTENQIRDRDIQSLIYVFDTIIVPSLELKEAIKRIVKSNTAYQRERSIDLTPIFDSNTETSVFFLVAKFVYEKDGWFKSFTKTNVFQKAYKLNSEKCLEFLFELLPDEMALGYNRMFSANLFNALCTIGYDSKKLISSWEIMYQMIEDRLPSFEKYDWETSLRDDLNMNLSEIHICILISRFSSYTTHRIHTVLSGIALLLFNNPSRMIKPIKWFFQNSEDYKDSITLCVLELLRLNEEENVGYIENFEVELKNLYPTHNFLIDHLIEKFSTVQPLTLIPPNDNLQYPISEEEVEYFTNLNRRHKNIMMVGLDLQNTFGKFKATFIRDLGESLDLYGNRMNKLTVSNIYFSDYMLKLINEDFYYTFKMFNNPAQVYGDIKIDAKSIVAQYLSRGHRPNSLNRVQEYKEPASCTFNIPAVQGWVRLGHYETELIKEDQDHFKLKRTKTFGGIVFSSTNKQVFPYSRYPIDLDYLWTDFVYENEIEETVVSSFIQQQLQLEDYKILWLKQSVLKRLGLNVSHYLNGICAVNKKDEVVLKFNSWQCEYAAIGYSHSVSDEIPKLDGSELLIRQDYFLKLCDLYEFEPKYSVITVV